MRSVKDIAWLAGLVEGEGAFMRRGGSPIISVHMCDRDIIARAAALFEVPGASSYQPKSKGTVVYKRVYALSVHGINAAGWMMTLYPLLGMRRRAKVKEILGAWRASDRAQRAPRGERYMASCHPDRVRAGRGLCRSCYMLRYRKERGYRTSTESRRLEKLQIHWGSLSLPPKRARATATCHPNQPAQALGLCKRCYGRQQWRKRHAPDDQRQIAI